MAPVAALSPSKANRVMYTASLGAPGEKTSPEVRPGPAFSGT